MPDQLRNCPAGVHREELVTELGKMPFYGQVGNSIGTYYFKEGN